MLHIVRALSRFSLSVPGILRVVRIVFKILYLRIRFSTKSSRNKLQFLQSFWYLKNIKSK